jgi:hypothetical protein
MLGGPFHRLRVIHALKTFFSRTDYKAAFNGGFIFTDRESVTFCITETLIKSLKIQLSLNVRLNQVTKDGNQIQRQMLKNFERLKI